MHGFGVVWETQGVGDVRFFLSSFKERLIDCAKQDWHSSLVSHDFYSVYTNYKQSFELCQYVVSVNKFYIRRLLSKFRIGMLDLNCRFLQYKPDVANDKKMCPFCCNTLETEIHFLLVCPLYQTLREDLIPAKYFKHPSMSKFALLMASTIPTTINRLAVFVYKAYCTRQKFIT